jgi:hypothetical protein
VVATTASEKSAPAEEGQSGRRRFWGRISKAPLLWRRIPTPLLVTVVGLVLSAWLLPALTRQWDDRQKADDLKSAIVTDMASASAQALIGGEVNWNSVGSPNVSAAIKARLARDWSLASLRIQARLRAYFPDYVVQAWQIYSWLIDRWDDSFAGTARANLVSLQRTQINLRPGAADAIARVITIDREVIPRPAPRLESKDLNHFLEYLALKKVEAFLGRRLSPVDNSRRAVYGPGVIEVTLLGVEEEIAAEVLAAHASGYSTTTGDFLHDLVP